MSHDSRGPRVTRVQVDQPRVAKAAYQKQYKSVAKVVPAASTSIFSDEFRSIVKKGVDATNKAAEALNELAPQLPAVLKSVDPAMKSDMAKVDEIIGKVCDEIMFEAKPNSRGVQYYTPDSIEKTCDYIKSISADLVGGLENPAIYQNYVEEMNGAIVKLNSFAALLL